MNTESKSSSKDPIQRPSANKARATWRATIEALASFIPYGGALVRILRTTHPPKSDQDRDRWQGEITERTNENTGRLDQHEELLSPKATLSGVTAQLVSALAQAPGDGMRGKGQTLDDLCQLIPNTDRKLVQDAAFEMESYGLVEIERALGNHWWLYLTQNIYEQVDHQLMGWRTEDDAAKLAQLMLDHDDMEAAPKLHMASGWDKRRFNPAFQYVLRFFPESRISGELQPNYPALSVVMLPEDKAALLRFLGSRTQG
jgi:hypothetical protein